MDGTLLVVNAGSSSIKFSLFEVADGRELRLASKGQMDGIGTQSRLRARDLEGAVLVDEKFSAADVPDVPVAMMKVGGWLSTHLGGVVPLAVGHRVGPG